MTTSPASLTPQEWRNIQTIERLNQRGGRMLSVVDLVAAGSLSLEAAAYLLYRIRRGASFLTAANPGGAGKTAVMGALLALTPPGAILREIRSAQDLSGGQPDVECPTWHICQELGAGRIPGYLWGSSIPAYFALSRAGSYLASNLHADTLEEVQQALCGAPNHLAPDHLRAADLILTLACQRLNGTTRRHIAVIYAAAPEGHLPVFAWDGEAGSVLPMPGLPRDADFGPERECLARLVHDGACELPVFRQRLLELLADQR